MHVTLVDIHVKPENIQEFITATAANHRASIQEPGNRRFDVLQDPADHGHFILYEAYTTTEEAAEHKQTAHYLTWRDTVADWMAKPRQGTPFNGLYPAETS